MGEFCTDYHILHFWQMLSSDISHNIPMRKLHLLYIYTLLNQKGQDAQAAALPRIVVPEQQHCDFTQHCEVMCHHHISSGFSQKRRSLQSLFHLAASTLPFSFTVAVLPTWGSCPQGNQNQCNPPCEAKVMTAACQ